MTVNQLDFTFGARQTRTATEYLDRFLEALSDGRWHKAGGLAVQLRISDRVLRKCADLSQGRVISGQEGYKLTRFATADEADHAERWLLSQARKMTERATEIRRSRNIGGRAA